MNLNGAPSLWIRIPAARQSGKLVLDMLLAFFAWKFARLGDVPSPYHWLTFAWVGLAGLVSRSLGLPRQHYRLFGFEDALRLAGGVLALGVGTGVLALASLLAAIPTPGAEVLVTATIFTGALWALTRLTFRLINEGLWSRRTARNYPDDARVTLIIGAGRAGFLVAQELRRHPTLGSFVVGFLDDALDKQGVEIQGIPVLGTTDQLSQIAQAKGIQRAVLAMPSASGESLRSMSETATRLGLEVKTVPGIYDLLGEKTWRPLLRDLSIVDLLRREPIELDQSRLFLALEDAVVLITGAGGSIGGELARQAAAFRPARLVLLGRGENSLWETERILRSEFPNQTMTVELCDIRSPHRLQQVFRRWRPRVVLHAAAHKHVPYLEQHAVEGVENNIFGTQNVLEASLAHDVSTFLNISTDKAVNPTNVLGATKRIAESLVLEASTRAPEGARFSSVRFGNVLGSRGSVIKVFQDQIQRGGPVTVTHPDMTRYFMTIPEASQLVLQAGLLGETGKVYVLDMGSPVRIQDLAMDMIRLSGLVPGQDVEITYSGVRPGEKLYEELFTHRELQEGNVHPKVLDARPEEISPSLLKEGLQALARATHLPDGQRQQEILHWLLRLVPSYHPSPNGLGRFAEKGAHSSTGPIRIPIPPHLGS